jgi:DNA-binding NtrC family response regulator
MMPDENVFDVLPRIRKERPKLPIIVMSAQNTLLTAVNAADAGAFEYISKPFDLDDVTSAARRALSRPADAEASKAQARAMRDERSAADRSLGADAGGLSHNRPTRRRGPDRADPRRKRHGQGAGRPRPARAWTSS